MKSVQAAVCMTVGAIFLISWYLYLTMQHLLSELLPQFQTSEIIRHTGKDDDAPFFSIVASSYSDTDNGVNATPQAASNLRSWNTPMTEGVDPIYLELLSEAERRSTADYKTSHARGDKGIVIGPTDGNFLSHTLLALRSARRMRNMLVDQDFRIALATTPEHIQILRTKCQHGQLPLDPAYQESCRLWANNTLFDDVIPIVDEYQWNDNFTRPEHVSSKYWLKSLSSYRHAPYRLSLVLDSDAFTCPGFENLFQMAEPSRQDVWQLSHQGQTDFAAGIDQYPFGTGLNAFLIPGKREYLQDYDDFPERNTGTMLFSFHRQLTHTFVHFVPLVAEYIWNHKASSKHAIINDQCPFRLAMYLFKRFHPEFVDQQIPQHACCRTYPGNPVAGTHAEKSRMMLLLADGTRCNDCMCTPCLITHFSQDYPVPVQGRMGYEEGFRLNAPYHPP
jgi:hypothetical protein